MNTHRKFITILFLIFFVTSISFIIAKKILQQWDIDNTILLIANSLLFLISVGTFMLQRKALTHNNPNVFIRSVLLGMTIKMFTCAIAVVIYDVVSGDKFNGKAVFVFMVLYVIYLIAEVASILKLNKQSNA